MLIQTATGPMLLSQDEARKRLEQLDRAWNWSTDAAERERITREADSLRRVIDPSLAYADVYAPAWYVPGWRA